MRELSLAEALNKINRFRQQAPVDIESMAQVLGIEVERAQLPKGLSGYISRENGQFKIVVNNDDPLTRQRFTIAHELGHFLLHKNIMGDGINDSKAYRTDAQQNYFNSKIRPHHETEANKFAATALMPMELVLQMKNKLLDADSIANALQVSKRALDIRLEDINKSREEEANLFGEI